MCNPMMAGMAVSAAAEYKKTDEANKNNKRMLEARGQAFKENMVRQNDYSEEASNNFVKSIKGQSFDNFSDVSNQLNDSRLNAFNSSMIEQPSDDYTFANAPKNVILSQNKEILDNTNEGIRDNQGLAKLGSYGDAMNTLALGRSGYNRAFGNLADKAKRDASLLPLDMQNAEYNAYKQPSPWLSLAGGAGKVGAMYGASKQ